ncbi:MAG: hypothetical protein BGO76_08220 [Caedibacter sp. 38-128]|nr:hypothetical protein [Holosporales bacterium]OJX04120.1 MAG: hypothetical protein BGO76_08220 [Caedibacter sp. 38-128]
MLNKTTTLVLLASLAATQGMWASNMQDDLSLSNSSSPRASSSAMPLPTDETPQAQPSSFADIFDELGDIDVGTFELSPSVPDSFEEWKDLDQNGSKYIGAKVKTFVEKKVPYGEQITTATTTFSKKVLGTETLTEYVVGKVRTPLKIEGDYPETVNGIIGQKAKNIVNLIPGGEKVTAVTAKIGRTLFGTPTLVEGILNKFTSNGSKAPEEKTETSDTETQDKPEDASASEASVDELNATASDSKTDVK